MGRDGLRGDTAAHYNAIIERNRERLQALTELVAKSPWAKRYLPIRPRRLTVTLMNGFRIAASRGGERDDEYRRLIASAVTTALANPSDPSTVCIVGDAIEGARRTLGLLNPKESGGTDPDPELSDEQHAQVETLLREWLYVAIAEFAPIEVA
jgi:hypothetical protein